MLRPPMESPGRALRDLMTQDIVVMPGVFNPISAMVAVQSGARALYLSGAGASNASLGLPDIGLIELSELAEIAAKICQVSTVPVLSDVDTGFGDAIQVRRTVIEMERAGLAGMHLEDQVSPKRCGHLDGKSCVPASDMAKKIRAAVEAKRDSDFLIVARTDARGVEGMDAAIERAKLYVDHGADAIFPEGLTSEAEFEAFRSALEVPHLANMTEFGKTPLIPVSRFREMGYQMVIFPMTAFRMMLRTLREAYAVLLEAGTQASLIGSMDTREKLYEVLHYSDYEAMDQKWHREVER